MPTIVVMVAVVATVTEAIKVWADKVGIAIKGILAVILAVLASAGVVAFYAINTQTAFSFGLVWIFVQVALAATVGYKFVTEKLGNNKPG